MLEIIQIILYKAKSGIEINMINHIGIDISIECIYNIYSMV